MIVSLNPKENHTKKNAFFKTGYNKLAKVMSVVIHVILGPEIHSPVIVIPMT